MSCFLRCLCLGLFVHCGDARVHTEAPAGPLYRVVGSPLSISCNVSGFAAASARQHFEFRVTKPENPGFEYNIVSTSSQGFSYSIFLDRVRSKEITLTHLSPTSVIFEIQSLQKSDEGEYDCSVINSEAIYDGTYSASTTVKVIDNSLSVSTPESTSLVFNEGDGLTLTCQASSNTVQHTHLSLAWYLQKDKDNSQLIISLDRDLTLRPGRGFEERYKAGLVRLDKIGEATYKLGVSQLELSDQGGIYCRAQEWIQDPDRAWYAIALQDAEETALEVKSREVVNDSSSMAVSISLHPTTLQEGYELSLSCNIDTQNLEKRFFSVAWLKGGVELARIGPTGLLSVGQEYGTRAEEGELRAARIGGRDYRLVLRPARTSDRGEYTCRAWPQDRDQDGVFTQGAAQDSTSVGVIPQHTSLSAPKSGLSLEMQNALSVNEGERLSLTCRVSGVKGQLSITWQYKTASGFTNVISLSQEGVMEKGGEFVSRKVKATRPAADTFTMELEEGAPSDSGVYQCAVSEWKTHTKISSQSRVANVTVAPADSFVRVNLISRNNIVTIGDNVELICRVRGVHAGLPITLAWSLQRDGSSLDSILTVYSDGAISWSGEQHRYQLQVQNKGNEINHYLLINGASHWEAGRYQCSASIFLANVHKQLPPSNQLAVKVQDPVQQLSILKEEIELNVSTSQNFSIPCDITKQSSRESEFQVTWFWQQEADAEQRPVLVVYRNSTLQMFGRGDQMRFGHPLPQQFQLTVLKPGPEDSGVYFCEVEEWLPTPSREWRKLAVEKSGHMTVGVHADGNIKASYEPECSLYTWIWILVAIIICALLVIFIMVLKMHGSVGGKKMQQPLWMERRHLKSKPCAEDGA
ncbi:immunoglobulin superfamily member 3-like [Brachionichthys hirsutus]|uniref:immunoglobulin superfamily member 3-like n=1 Tax=Brachionichthys hirsutus TaxID=412623 RepID=UPI00360442B6